MGLFSGLLGNASEVKTEAILEKFEEGFTSDETVEKAFRVIRDLFVFTNKRFILIDIQGATGKKVEFKSFPYSSIAYFSVESAGHFDLDSELKIFIRGIDQPIIKQFKKGSDIWGVQRALVNHL